MTAKLELAVSVFIVPMEIMIVCYFTSFLCFSVFFLIVLQINHSILKSIWSI